MELDNLKMLWKDMNTKDVHPNSDEQILVMLQQKSHSPIAKMKRNLQWELITIVLLYSLPIWYFLTASKARYWQLAAMLLIIGVCFLFYYYYKNKLLGQMQCVTCEVQSNLQRQLTTLEKYVRFYFVSGTILTPVAFFATAFIVWSRSTVNGTYIPLDTSQYTFLIGVGILITIFSYFFNLWYVNRLYGRHIHKLKELLQQMEEKEPIA
jgi:hypothetical protein